MRLCLCALWMFLGIIWAGEPSSATPAAPVSTASSPTPFPVRLKLDPAVDRLPVLHNSRIKPLHVAASELLLTVTSGTAPYVFAAIPGDERRMRPSEIVLSLALDQRWSSQPWIAAPYAPVQLELRIGAWFSFAEGMAHLGRWQQLDRLHSSQDNSGVRSTLSQLDEQILETGRRWSLASALVSGLGFELFPVAADQAGTQWLAQLSEQQLTDQAQRTWRSRIAEMRAKNEHVGIAWLSLGDCLADDAVLATRPGEELALLKRWLASLRSGDAAEQRQATEALSAAILASARRASERQSELVEHVPSQAVIDLEMTYHRVRPFTIALWISLAAVVCLAFALIGRGGRSVRVAGGVLLTVAGLVAFSGLLMRLLITQQGMVRTFFDTLMFVGFIAAVMALLLAWWQSRKANGAPMLYVFAGAVSLAMCSWIGEAMPPEKSGNHINTLMPVLRNQFWLWTHVKIIVGSYAPFALAWVIGNVLLLKAVRARQQVAMADAMLVYRCMQIGLVMLIAGTLLGGWWAAKSWGRFWGWDPKEVYALVAILVYLIPLHLRLVKVVGPTGLAAWGVGGFLAIVMSWYGTNYILGAGRHAYATGEGGMWYVLGLCALQVVWLVFAMARMRGLPAHADSAVPANPGAAVENRG